MRHTVLRVGGNRPCNVHQVRHHRRSGRFGAGAGVWLDATAEPWSAHYRRESWLISELLPAVELEFEIDGSRRGVFGHSMGGHGALT
ncbi:MAG: alpha/beta hydrolase-fold protein, partial [Pseudomonadota bacterium]|nr:alpha/beta hydrolase-fold protein [Pseudomonadota bacterium]